MCLVIEPGLEPGSLTHKAFAFNKGLPLPGQCTAEEGTTASAFALAMLSSSVHSQWIVGAQCLVKGINNSGYV